MGEITYELPKASNFIVSIDSSNCLSTNLCYDYYSGNSITASWDNDQWQGTRLVDTITISDDGSHTYWLDPHTWTYGAIEKGETEDNFHLPLIFSGKEIKKVNLNKRYCIKF